MVEDSKAVGQQKDKIQQNFDKNEQL